jgi:hypothetical protein
LRAFTQYTKDLLVTIFCTHSTFGFILEQDKWTNPPYISDFEQTSSSTSIATDCTLQSQFLGGLIIAIDNSLVFTTNEAKKAFKDYRIDNPTATTRGRQIDDFAIVVHRRATAEKLCALIGVRLKYPTKDKAPIKFLGLHDKFIGTNIHQTRHYTKLSCESYIQQMLQLHGWEQPSPNKNLPLKNTTLQLVRLKEAPNTSLWSTR